MNALAVRKDPDTGMWAILYHGDIVRRFYTWRWANHFANQFARYPELI